MESVVVDASVRYRGCFPRRMTSVSSSCVTEQYSSLA